MLRSSATSIPGGLRKGDENSTNPEGQHGSPRRAWSLRDRPSSVPELVVVGQRLSHRSL